MTSKRKAKRTAVSASLKPERRYDAKREKLRAKHKAKRQAKNPTEARAWLRAIPAERMKMKTEHIVPLAPQALAVLRELRSLSGSDASPFLFPSPSREGFMSYNTMLFALYRMGYHGRATVHGFRAMASTALNEMGFRPDVIERQLAHEERNRVRVAYNRAEYLGQRRGMMNRWADYLGGEAGKNVVHLRTTA